MASPFSIFRKHEKVMMVVLVIMAMFAFTLTDLFTQSTLNVPFFAFLIGGGGMALAGISAGKSLQYGIFGGVVGLVLGYVVPQFFPPAPAVTIRGEGVTDEELQDMIQRRSVANQFVQLYWSETQKKARDAQKTTWLAENADKTDADFDKEVPFRPQNSPVIFSYGRPLDEDVVLGMLLRTEAEQMGVAVSDESVNDLLTTLCNRAGGAAGIQKNVQKKTRLTAAEFKDVRGNLQYKGSRVDEETLFSILKEEIRAQLAFRLLIPRVVPTPEHYWDMYRRLHVRQEMEMVAVPVDDFLDQVTEEPSEADLNDLFDRWKDKVPNQQNGGEPGFLQLSQVQLALLEVDYLAVEKSVGEPTEDELKQYYKDNKEARFKNRQIPLPEGGGSPDGPSLPTPPVLPPPSVGPDGAKESTDGGENGGETTGGKPDTAEGAAGEPGNEPSEPKGEPDGDGAKSEESGGTSAPELKALELKAPETGTSKDPVEDPNTAKEDDCSPQDEPAGAAQEAPAAGDEPPAGGQPSGDEPAADDSPKNPTEAPPLTVPTLPAPGGDEKQGTEDKGGSDAGTDTKPAGDSADNAPSEGGSEDGGDTTGEKPEEVPDYRPFEDVRDLIRDEILKDKTTKLISEKIEKISDQMREYSREMSVIDAEGEESAGMSKEEVADKLKALADADEVIVYRETALMNREEMAEEEEAVAQATDPLIDSFEKSTVIEDLFPGENQLFNPQVGEDVSGNQFVYWVIEEVPIHVPTSIIEGVEKDGEGNDIPGTGVKGEVVLAWKRLQARDLAQARAEKLGEMVTAAVKDGGTFADGLPNETVTGETVEAPKTEETEEPAEPDFGEDSLKGAVVETLPFSWLRTPSTPSLGFGQRVELSRILTQGAGEVEGAGDDFMKDVFTDLDAGEVGIVSSFDKATWYVVRPKNRTVVISGMMARNETVLPENQENLDRLRTSFLDEFRMVNSQLFGLMSPIPQLVGMEQQRINYDWSVELEKDYEVTWTNRNGAQ